MQTSIEQDKFTLRVRQIKKDTVAAYGLAVNPERIHLFEIEGTIRAMFNVLTHEDMLAQVPADWWQHFKSRWFPAWLLRRSPPKYTEIMAIHVFPELAIPEQVLGREFVHLRIIKSENLVRTPIFTNKI